MQTKAKSRKWLGTEWLGVEYKTVPLTKTEQYTSSTQDLTILLINTWMSVSIIISRGHKRNAKTFEMHIDIIQNKITSVWETALVCN